MTKITSVMTSLLKCEILSVIIQIKRYYEGRVQMKPLSEKITDFYLQKNIIKSDMKNIYEYGVSLIINDIVTFTMILLLSLVIGNVLYGIIFLFAFCTARVYCGGFHAKKAWVCKCTMILTYLSVYLSVKFTEAYYTIFLGVIIGIISLFVLIPIIPIENPNKRLSKDTKEKNKKSGIIVTFLYCTAAVILTCFGIQEGAVISFTMLSVAILAIVGKINNEKGGMSHE